MNYKGTKLTRKKKLKTQQKSLIGNLKINKKCKNIKILKYWFLENGNYR